ncbi:MAG: 3'-5' exoribonuclease YhaM family protein [Erysipelotrichaceae bacterium]
MENLIVSKISEIRKDDLKNGLRFDGYLLISAVNVLLNNKEPYLSMTLQDDSGTLDTKLWKATPEQISLCKLGEVIHFKGDLILYRDAIQFRATEVLPPVLIANPADFVKRSAIDRDTLRLEIQRYVEKIQTASLRTMIEVLLERNNQAFFEYPSAMRIHHAYAGGLATHVLEMLRHGEVLADIYPWLNKDLLLAGIIVHDFGKTIELSGAVATEYTLQGKLIGHISIMQSLIDTLAIEQGVEHNEEIILLRHMVLSHHGRYEYGSPVLPMIPEAEMLYFVDNIGARMDTLKDALDGIEEGEFTPRMFALDNRSFYKAKK